MISGCIDRMRHDSCGSCERRDACSFIWTGLRGLRAAGERRRTLERPSGTAKNPFLSFLGEVAKSIERRAQPQGGAFSKEVERYLEPLLASGEIRIDIVARGLGLSRQTLYRRLKAEGVTFEQLLDRLRRRLALRFVREQGMAVKEAAWRLGFSDPAAFSRAFKRWTGKSPGGSRPSPDQPG